jgi:ankyrin
MSYAFQCACKNGTVDDVINVLKSTFIDPEIGLSFACYYGHLEVVKLLLQRNADVNIKSVRKTTPLYRAIREGHLEIAKLILQKNADVNIAESEEGMAPLHEASVLGNLEIVKLILKKNANVNIKNINGLTPLYLAVLYNHLEIVKELLEKNENKSFFTLSPKSR